MISDKEIQEIRKELLSAKKPFIFFHDDPDGLASFLLCYRKIKKGRGMTLKAFPQLKVEHAEKVDSFGADKVFILDIAMADQEFLDAIAVPKIWVDHHDPQQRENVKYFNPRVTTGDNIPTPALIYPVVEQDLWIATVGAVGDWYYPPFAEEFKKQYPDLLPENIKTVEDALFNSEVGKLVKVFSFNLKGSTQEFNTSIKILTRIQTPYEILNQETPAGKFLYKKYEKINKVYEKMFDKIKKSATDDRLLVHTYESDQLSLTKDLANELLYHFKNKVIILGREKDDEVRCSLRAPKDIFLPEALQRALEDIQGYGGGHEHACGAGIKKHDFQKFIENLRRELNL